MSRIRRSMFSIGLSVAIVLLGALALSHVQGEGLGQTRDTPSHVCGRFGDNAMRTDDHCLENVTTVPKINGRTPINSEYAGKFYPSSKLPANIRTRYPDGVPFNQKGFPVFPSKADVELLPAQHMGSRAEHFRLANRQLRIQEQQDPGYLMRQGLNQRQIDHIMKNPPSSKSPPGLTWHHNEKPGVMQLVPRDIHDAVRHTGGHSIWGRGQ